VIYKGGYTEPDQFEEQAFSLDAVPPLLSEKREVGEIKCL
jgi:hypothetical protein